MTRARRIARLVIAGVLCNIRRRRPPSVGRGCPMKKRVLVVEDDANLAALLRENLLFEGFEVDWVQDGAQVLGRAKSFVPDLIVLDIMLPNVNGFELCRGLRQHGRTPVLILSARSHKVDKL